jgi:TonB family protein
MANKIKIKFFIILFTFLSFLLPNDLNINIEEKENYIPPIFNKPINESFSYPEVIKNFGITLRSIVEFQISNKGEISDIYIISSDLGNVFDDMILRGVQKLDITPAKIGNKSISVRYRLPIVFKPI